MVNSDIQIKHIRRAVWLLGAVCVGTSAIAVWALMSGHAVRIGYVRSNDLMSRYTGSIEAQSLLTTNIGAWKANLDTLQAAYEQSARPLADEQAQKIQQYTSGIERKAKDQEAQLLTGVLNQINSYIAQYGRDHGYDLILGTTASGSLLYAGEGTDLTEQILGGLNAQYRRTPSTTQGSR